MASGDVDDMIIRHNGGRRSICFCGEEGSLYGAQGSVDLVDDLKGVRICTLIWRAAMYRGERNEFRKLNQNTRYKVDIGRWNQSGVLGDIPVIIEEQI